MAAINFSVYSKKEYVPIYIRLSHTKLYDFKTKTGILIPAKDWDVKKQKVKRSIAIPYEEYNATLERIKFKMYQEFSQAYISGESITKEWFEDCVKNLFSRPEEEKNGVNLHEIYYSDWVDYWLKHYASTYKIASDKYISETTIRQYEQFLIKFKKFEGRKKIKLKGISEQIMDDFSSYLSNDLGLAYETVKRELRRLYFFCARAEDKGIRVNSEYKATVYISKDKKKNYLEPYFTPQEIDTIFNLDIEINSTLDHVRDNLIISCWTGLRISDFLRLNLSNINGDMISFEETKKTKVSVMIPIHPQVRYILNKRDGSLPVHTSDQYYNSQIKEICKLAGLNNLIEGGKVDVIDDYEGKRNRKIFGVFPKYELVTSHIGRRSFATNLHGKVSNSVIMAAGGWKSEQMMLSYIKKTKNDQALELKKFWDNQNKVSNL